KPSAARAENRSRARSCSPGSTGRKSRSARSGWSIPRRFLDGQVVLAVRGPPPLRRGGEARLGHGGRDEPLAFTCLRFGFRAHRCEPRTEPLDDCHRLPIIEEVMVTTGMVNVVTADAECCGLPLHKAPEWSRL